MVPLTLKKAKFNAGKINVSAKIRKINMAEGRMGKNQPGTNKANRINRYVVINNG